MSDTEIYVGDFETTVYDGQDFTEVWAAACVKIGTEDVKVFHSIVEQYQYFVSLNRSIICYYHNLKFDGSFWLSFLLVDMKFKQAYTSDREDLADACFVRKKDMKNRELTYSISDMGQWYRITFKVGGHTIELRDSLKLLPFSVEKIGKSFQTKHKKLHMEYKGIRYAGCPISDEEKEYIKNDVLVVKEALEIAFEQGHNKLTIGSCCLSEFKKTIGRKRYDSLFPDVYQMPIDKELYGAETAGEYIHKAYHGGWCYVVKGKEGRIFRNGLTADVNSLYPSMMHSESGNFYPVGEPTFWKGNFIPKEALQPAKYFFIRFRTQFKIKDGFLPFIQVKHTFLYKPREMLTTSDILNDYDGKYYDCYYDFNGELKKAVLTLTMTMTDFILFRKHYNYYNFEILDGCYFNACIGIFDKYIDKYKKIKIESTGAVRELAKLFLNNLYGKTAANKDSSFKIAFVKEDKSIGFYTVHANDKKPGYIPVGAAITSYARAFTITAAQLNFHGVDNPGFIYADTDSIHCDLPASELKGIKEHDTAFCCWKLESNWDEGIFTRPKTYIEHVTHENHKPVTPYYNVKCAGMGSKCKDLFIESMTQDHTNSAAETEEDFSFVNTPRTIEDFTIGLAVPGKLVPKRIPGGTLLVETTYEMR